MAFNKFFPETNVNAFSRMQIEFEDPAKEWKITNYWFSYQSRIRVRIRRAPLHP